MFFACKKKVELAAQGIEEKETCITNFDKCKGTLDECEKERDSCLQTFTDFEAM